MFKNIWISIFFSSLLFSSAVFSKPQLSAQSTGGEVSQPSEKEAPQTDAEVSQPSEKEAPPIDAEAFQPSEEEAPPTDDDPSPSSKSGPSVRYFSAFDVHSLNKSKISDAECQALFPSKWTKSTATLKRGQVTQIDFGGFKMLDMKTRVVQPGVYDAVLKKIPEENSLCQDIRHGRMSFELNGEPVSSPATMIATFNKEDVLGPDPFAKLIYVFKSHYCSAQIKSKKNL